LEDYSGQRVQSRTDSTEGSTKDPGHKKAGNAWNVTHDLHDKQGEQLVRFVNKLKMEIINSFFQHFSLCQLSYHDSAAWRTGFLFQGTCDSRFLSGVIRQNGGQQAELLWYMLGIN
jgi:hypothetical protein